MKPASYRITVRGRLSDRFVSAFHGMTLEAKNGPLVGERGPQGGLEPPHRLQDVRGPAAYNFTLTSRCSPVCRRRSAALRCTARGVSR